MYLVGQTVVAEFTLQNQYGAASNADSLPVGVLSHDGVDDGAVTVAVTNKATGLYKASALIPSGYDAGDSFGLRVTATVGGRTATKVLLNSSISETALTGYGPYSVTVNAGTPGASVSLTQGIDIVKGLTGNDGTITLNPAGLDTYALVVTKAGYQSISRDEVLVDGMEIDAELQATVIPQPSDPLLCKPYGYFKKPNQEPWIGLKFNFYLLSPEPTSGGRIIANRTATLVADINGEIGTSTDEAENVKLDRNDAISPPGTSWNVVCAEADVDVTLTLEAGTFDLGSLVRTS